MNCKPGDLAVVIYAETTPELIGKIVTVIRSAIIGEQLEHGILFRPHREIPAWICEGYQIPNRASNGILYLVRRRPIGDEYLRPIRPDESPEQSIEAMRDLMQTKKEKETT